jgi:hypothetical protein
MADKDLELNIKTTADASGLREVDTVLTDIAKSGIRLTEDQTRAWQEFQAEKKKLADEEQAEQQAAFDQERAQRAKLEKETEEAINKELALKEKLSGQQASTTERQLRDIRQVEAAEQTAGAARAAVFLQRVAQLKDVASQAMSTADSITEVMRVLEDENATAAETFDAVAKAGTEAAGVIAQAWAAGGPVAAVAAATLVFKDGLAAIFKDAEEMAQELEERMAAPLEDMRRRIEKAAGRGAEGSPDRENAERRRLRDYREAERAGEDARRNLSRDSTLADLDNTTADPVERARRQLEIQRKAREDAARIEQQEAQQKIQADAAEQAALRAALEQRRSDQARQENAAKSLSESAALDPKGESVALFNRQLESLAKTTEEIAKLEDALSKASQRRLENAERARSGQADASDDLQVIDRRGRNQINSAEERSAQKGARDAQQMEAEARRGRAQREANEREAGREAGRDLGSRVSRASRGASGPVSDEISAATDALKDGATAEELTRVRDAFAAFGAEAVSLSQRQRAEASKLWKEINEMRKQLKNARD